MQLNIVAAGKAIIGTGIVKQFNVTSVARTGVGAYTLTLTQPSGSIVRDGSGNPSQDTVGIVLATVAGAFKIDAEFTDPTHIAVSILNLSGAAADPPNGTAIKMIAFQ